MRRYYLREPLAPRPHWYEFATVVEIPAGADVQQVVAQIAQELELQPDSENADSYRGRSAAGFAFMMDLQKNENSLWILRLIDWPTTRRSDLSRRAERELRRRLEVERSDKPPQPTPAAERVGT